MNDFVIKMAQVVSVDDESDGMRIKARLSIDEDKGIDDLPYSFPLLPKQFQVMPKIGECVLILTSKANNIYSNRYYIGPVISQHQKIDYDPYDNGRGSAISLLQGSSVEPLAKLSNYVESNGAFPNKEDIAIIGRESEDIIVKDGEIDLRCGIRKRSFDNDPNLVGNVIFNNINPSYIQMKFKRNIGRSSGQEADSIINIVSDKINLISHKDDNSLPLTNRDELIKSEDLDYIMSKLHELPYGDILIEVLEIIRNAILFHVHPYPGMPPCREHYINTLNDVNFEKILSNNVRIS